MFDFNGAADVNQGGEVESGTAFKVELNGELTADTVQGGGERGVVWVRCTVFDGEVSVNGGQVWEECV